MKEIKLSISEQGVKEHDEFLDYCIEELKKNPKPKKELKINRLTKPIKSNTLA